MKEFNRLCLPAKIYFGIAVIASILALINGIGFVAVIFKLIFAFIWTFVLGWLCDNKMPYVAWFLVLLPYLLIFLAMVGIFRATREHTQIMRTLQLQGAFGQEAFKKRGGK